MPSKERRPSLKASPLSKPSAWQLRFGRRPATNQQQDDDEPRAHTASSNRLRSSPPLATTSIADQLLQSLADRERAGRHEHELSRDCAERLLGKRNAFASDLRMDDKVAAELAQQSRGSDDVSALAKELIRSRMQVEDQAEALRRAGKDRSRTRGAPPPSRPVLSSAERLLRLRDAQTRRDREHKAEVAKVSRALPPFQRASDGKSPVRGAGEVSPGPEDSKEELNNETSPSASHPQTHRARSMLSQCVRTAITRSSPPQPDPVALMEQRQAKIREKREARKLQPKSVALATSRGALILNQGEGSGRSTVRSEEKQLQERIARLTTENQHAVELAERIRAQKRQWEAKSAVFAAWKRLLLSRQECAAHAFEVFRWRTLRRLMARWRNYCVSCRRKRVANESRERCVREQSILTRADTFYRKKQLPRWFYRWVASAAAAKERRRADGAAQRRRQQAQRLMERLIRGPESSEASKVEDDAPPCYQSPIPEHPQPKATSRQQSSASSSSRPSSRATPTASRGRHTSASGPSSKEDDPPTVRQSASSSQSSPSSAPPPPPTTTRAAASTATPPRSSTTAPADPIYVSMLERASERKERREVLRLKYERAQQEKRETLAMQIEDRSAALMRVKEAERQRLREKKREATAVARAKQERLEQAADLLHRARVFDRQRLLRYYAFAPWKFQHECRLRVARYADSWHAMRVMHDRWLQWQALVAERRRERRVQELERLALAARHYEESLRRRVWQAWKQHLMRIEDSGDAVERQSRRFAAKRAWNHWQRRLADERAEQYARQVAVEHELEQGRLLRALQGWRRAAVELAMERERQIEKQQLWSKVRGWLDEGGA